MDLDLAVSDIEEYPDDDNDKDFDINEYKSTGDSDDYRESDNYNENVSSFPLIVFKITITQLQYASQNDLD